MQRTADSHIPCAALGSAAPIRRAFETELCAPGPLRFLATRLRCGASEHGACLWHAYLPQRLQQQAKFHAAAAAAVPAYPVSTDFLARHNPADACAGDKHEAWQNSVSTRSTSLSDTQNEELCDQGSSVVGRVWELSQDPLGSRVVQAALERASSEEQRCLLAHELCGHLHEAMKCPHGNHVVQKIISTMQQPESLQFIVDAISQQGSSLVVVAKHKYASRIIKHLLKACPASQVSEIIESLLEVMGTLACNLFGRIFVEHLLERGTQQQQYRLMRSIEQNAVRIVQTSVGRGILESLLSHKAIEDQDKAWMCRACAQDPTALLSMALGKRGHAIVLVMLDILEALRDERIHMSLAQHFDTLRASQFGRAVAQRLDIVGAESGP